MIIQYQEKGKWHYTDCIWITGSGGCMCPLDLKPENYPLPKDMNISNSQSKPKSACCGAEIKPRTMVESMGICSKCKMVSDTVSVDNYERHSHTHCWNQISPACGQPIDKHTQCCLCSLKVPVATNNSEIRSSLEASEKDIQTNSDSRLVSEDEYKRNENIDWMEEFQQLFFDLFIPDTNGIPDIDRAYKIRVCGQRYIDKALFFIAKKIDENRIEAYFDGQKNAFGVDRERVKEEGRQEERKRILNLIKTMDTDPTLTRERIVEILLSANIKSDE